MSQYIGKTISLISSKGIRYVGTLSDVNGEEATVTLKNVKPFGTEGRIGDPSKEILPVDDVYPVVVFRGSDVRDLSVLDDAPPTTASSASTVPEHVVPQQQYEPVKDDSSDESEDEKEIKKEVKKKEEEEVKPQPQVMEKEEDTENTVYQRRPKPQGNFANASVPDADFDFESANAKFNEMDIKDDLQREKDTTELSEPAYDKKKSFFDNISNSATERRPQRPDFGNNQGGNGRPDFGNYGSGGRPRPDFGNGNRPRPDFGNGGNRRRGGGGRGRGGYKGQWSNDGAQTSNSNDYGAY